MEGPWKNQRLPPRKFKGQFLFLCHWWQYTQKEKSLPEHVSAQVILWCSTSYAPTCLAKLSWTSQLTVAFARVQTAFYKLVISKELKLFVALLDAKVNNRFCLVKHEIQKIYPIATFCRCHLIRFCLRLSQFPVASDQILL